MKLTFYSTYLTSHQLAFCNALYELLQDDFTYVSCYPLSEERMKLGYPDLDHQLPYVVRAYESSDAEDKARKLALVSDVVLIGSGRERYYAKRIFRKIGLTFRISERIFKTTLSLRQWLYLFIEHIRYQPFGIYLLAAGKYVAQDYKKIGAYHDRCYQWGYFPDFFQQQLTASKNVAHGIEILWVGRMISWKHPEWMLKLNEVLSNTGFSYHITMIGDGPLFQTFQERAKGFNHLDLIGALPQSQVQQYYQKSHIFCSTSDQQEGWGAVINEAMHAKCCVVANDQIGATSMIQDHQNGFLFHTEEEFIECIQYLLSNPEHIAEVGQKGFETIQNLWNGKEAASRFLTLCESLQNNSVCAYPSGPCQKEEI